MKKLKMLGVCLVVLLAVSTVTKADFYEMDVATAESMADTEGMGFYTTSGGGDYVTLDYIGYNPGDLSDRLYGEKPNYGDNMVYAVGFAGDMTAAETDELGSASITVGLYNGGASLGLSGDYEGWLLPLSNDNDDIWSYQAYVIYNTGSGEVIVYSGEFVDLMPDTQTSLLVSTPDGLDYSDIVGIGFTIAWFNVNNPDDDGGYRTGDTYHTSVVPVPGAILLGLFGIGAAGLKLRKFA